MRDSSRVLIMYGASRVAALFDSALCVRGCDGTVCTTNKRVKKRALLSTDERWRTVKVIQEGESVFS